jgi:hypothetical protein
MEEPQGVTAESVDEAPSTPVPPDGVKPERARTTEKDDDMPPPPPPRIFLPYRKDAKWHGRIMYECASCSFSTLDEETMLAHVGECKRMGGS